MDWMTGLPQLLVMLLLVAGGGWVLVYGDPATDEAKAALIMQVEGDAEAEVLVRVLLNRPNVQSADIRHMRLRIERMQAQRRAQHIVRAFLAKS